MRTILGATSLLFACWLMSGCGPARHWISDNDPQCQNCRGTGTFRCTKCLGRSQSQCDGYGCNFGKVQCSGCNGTGRVGNQNCYSCNGQGRTNCFLCGGTGTKQCDLCNGTGLQKCGRWELDDPKGAGPTAAPAPAAQPLQAKPVTLVKGRMWQGVTPDEMFSSIIQWLAKSGIPVLSQNKEQGTIDADWQEQVDKNNVRFRMKRAYVITAVSDKTQVRMKLTLERHTGTDWQELEEGTNAGLVAVNYNKQFEGLSKALGKPYIGQ